MTLAPILSIIVGGLAALFLGAPFVARSTGVDFAHAMGAFLLAASIFNTNVAVIRLMRAQNPPTRAG